MNAAVEGHEVGTTPELALMRPVKAGNAFEETVERLLQMIRLGVVPPGDRLPPERELSTRLGVSRATLRDALSELTKSGWVEGRRGRAGGTFVTSAEPADGPSRGRSADASELADILATRRVIEVGTAELAAGSALPAAARRELGTRLDAVCDATVSDYRRLDSRLHLSIAEVTGATSLVRYVADCRIQVNALLDQIPSLEPNLRHANDQHREIVEAILGGDTAAARQAMIDHLDGTAALLRGFLS